jgi:hypothetical protein
MVKTDKIRNDPHVGILKELRLRLAGPDDAPPDSTDHPPARSGQVGKWRQIFPRGAGPRLHNIVGEASYMENIIRIAGHEMRESCRSRYPAEESFAYSSTYMAELVREPGNPYDPDAVAVYVEGLLMGYLARGENLPVAQAMDGQGFGRVVMPSGAYMAWKIRDDNGRRIPFERLKVGVKLR